METKEVALRLQGVKKRYRLGQIGGGTLTADLQSWWARARGREVVAQHDQPSAAVDRG